MELVENKDNLTEIDLENGSSGSYDNCMYIYVGKKSSKIHFHGPQICDKIPIGCHIRIRYLHENNLFLTSGDVDNGNKVSNATKKDSDELYHNCVHIQHVVNKLNMTPLPPKKVNKITRGVRRGAEPYMFKGEIGYILDIEEFKPQI